MHGEFLRDFLLYSLAINCGVLVFWFVAILLAKDTIHRLHGRWFRLQPEQFDAIHYLLIGAYKLGIVLFNAVPLLALWLIGRGGS
jgi:hypothetical protein